MSKVEKLSITGLRSFSPHHEARLDFFSPLTLILGQNGCGKTTIIESLKYITTGDVPPGCGKGANFVHDSKYEENIRWVKAQVKILLRDTRGEKITCVRSMEATHHTKRIELKTLDATICRTRPDGTKTTITSKCADFQTEMTVFLGVSKPILRNVIFCHQEESNWPLDEGKRVKEKFDAIFSATKYIKCLETMRKLRMNMKKDLKQSEEILQAQLKWKEEAARKKTDLSTNEEDVRTIDANIEELEQQRNPISSRLNKIEVVENNLLEYSKKIGGKEAELKTLMKAQDEHRSSVITPITCPDDELLDMILNFDRQLKEKENAVKHAESKVLRLESEIQRYKREESKEVERLGILKAEHTSYLGIVEGQNVKLKTICQKFEFNAYKDYSEFTNEDAEDIINLVLAVINDHKMKIQADKTKFEQKEKTMQEEISNVRIKEATLDHDIKICNESEAEFKSKIKNLQKTILRTNSDLSSTSIETIQQDIVNCSKQLENEESKLSINDINEEIRTLKSEEKIAEEKLDDVKVIINRMNRQVDLRAKYESKAKDLKENKTKVQMLKSKCSDELEHIFEDGVPEENLKNELHIYSTDLQRRLAECRTKEKDLNKRKTQLDTKIQSQEKEFNRKDNECKALDLKIQDRTGGAPLEEVLEKSKIIIEEKGRDEGQLSSSVTILNGYVGKLRQRSCCPLCHRDFEDASSKDDLIEELEMKVQNIPKKLQAVKTEVEKQKKLHDDIIELKPQRDILNKLIKDCDNLRSSLEKDKQEVRKVQVELEEVTEIKSIYLNNEEIVNTLKPDIAIIENTMKRVKEMNTEVENLKVQLGNTEECMTREEALNQESELNKKTKSLRRQREDKNNILETHKNTVDTLKNRVMSLKQKHLDMKNKIQELESMKTEKGKLEKEVQILCEKREIARADVAPLKSQIKHQEAEKNKLTRQKEQWLEDANDKVSKIQDKHRGIVDRKKNILNYIDSRGEERLRETEAKVESLGDTIKTKDAEKKGHEDRIKEIQKELTTQIKEKHALDEEKKYRDKEIEVTEVKKEIDQLNEEVKAFNGEALRREKMKLSNKWNDLHNRGLELRGQRKEKQARIDTLKRELLHKDFRNAEKNYREKMIEIKCNQIAVDDLNKYYKALDTSIMKFHNEKMTIINRIIRELWRSTYKGNDIDTIEIKTDESESQGADKRRIYNYRVVMKKNDKDMDMRGRCSAGQKVLASLIIRIALAETFSTNCGILALDEPTTNLDKENIESLANALLSIVRRRSTQRNFQLIVITHDEEFLQILTRADYLEYFYKLSRDERGLSRIIKHKAD